MPYSRMAVKHTIYYATRRIAPDYIRAGIGLFGSLAALMFLDMLPILAVLTSGFACLCVIYGWDAVRRHYTRLNITDDSIVIEQSKCHLQWNDLRSLTLAYYSMSKESQHGWMEARMMIGHRLLRVDSRAVGFADLVRQAVATAERSGLQLSPTTLSNVNAISEHAPEHSLRGR